MVFDYYKQLSIIEFEGEKYLQVENVHADGTITVDVIHEYDSEDYHEEMDRVKKFNTFVAEFLG